MPTYQCPKCFNVLNSGINQTLKVDCKECSTRMEVIKYDFFDLDFSANRCGICSNKGLMVCLNCKWKDKENDT